jgi:hypothetical protein
LQKKKVRFFFSFFFVNCFAGLEKVEESAVHYVQQALQAHLTRLVAAAPPVVRSETNRGIKREREEEFVISNVSLRIAADKNGQKLLCDDLPMQRERLLLN